MRPPEFTGGNPAVESGVVERVVIASMRPPEFTGGNHRRDSWSPAGVSEASMRPPEFTGGNPSRRPARSRSSSAGRFNEAAGIHRRKPRAPITFAPPVMLLQ